MLAGPHGSLHRAAIKQTTLNQPPPCSCSGLHGDLLWAHWLCEAEPSFLCSFLLPPLSGRLVWDPAVLPVGALVSLTSAALKITRRRHLRLWLKAALGVLLPIPNKRFAPMQAFDRDFDWPLKFIRIEWGRLMRNRFNLWFKISSRGRIPRWGLQTNSSMD